MFYINLKGCNSSRKTTRVNCLLEYCRKHDFTIESKDYGLLVYNDEFRIFFFGKFLNGKIVGLDSKFLKNNSIIHRYELIKELNEKHNLTYLITEGYFNNHISLENENPKNLKLYGIDDFRFYVYLFDNDEEMFKSQESRSTQNIKRDKSKKHLKDLKRQAKHFLELPEVTQNNIKIYNYDDRNDRLVFDLFNDSYEYNPQNLLNSEEW